MMNRFLLRAFFLVVVGSITTQCTKNEVTPRDYPRMRTLAVTNISDFGAVYNGEIIHPGNQKIIEYGFVWQEIRENPKVELAQIKVFNDDINSGAFSTQIDTNLVKGVVYYVRAYSKTSEYLVYGQNMSFVSQGSKN